MTPEVAVTPVKDRRRGSDFAELSRLIQGAGLLRRRHRYYSVKIAATVAVFAATWVAFAFLGDTWWQLATAAFLAVVSTQVAFLGHDAGHLQILRGRRANDVIGFLSGGLVGLSYGWWVGKHNRHHANPNHTDDDPDLDIPVLAFTTGQSELKRGVSRWITKYQAFLFFPLLLLEGLSLHLISIQAAWRAEVKAYRIERVLQTVHVVAYLAAVFVVLPPLTGLAFVAVHQGLWGLFMGCSFAPNHKGMATLSDGHGLDFLRKQALTSRNVRGGRWVDFALGGLNYQIEHHLFPGMPRPNLRHAQPIVRDFCLERGIGYSECGLLRSYAQVLGHLHAVGAPLRAA